MFDDKPLIAVALAAVLLLAGCSSAVPGAGDGDGTGMVNVYVSDQQNAIGQFDSLNVTVSEVTFVRENESGEDEQVSVDANGTTLDLTELQGANASRVGSASVPNGTYTHVVLNVTVVEGTLTDGTDADVKLPSERLRLNENVTVGDGEEVDFVFDVSVVERGTQGYILKPVASESGTGDEVEISPVGDRASVGPGSDGAAPERTDSEDRENRTTADGQEMSFYVSDQKNAIGQFDSLNATITEIGVHRADTNGSDGEWVRRDANATVDLTELQGANATQIDRFPVENGSYDQVYIAVDSVEGTLTDGSSVDVKLPSQRLRVNNDFEVRQGENVSFVFDITVFERGPNGYIIRPVASETGTGDQVEIDPVDDENDAAEDAESDDAESDDAESDDARELEAEFESDPIAGENATLVVTDDDGLVANATAEVTQNGTTDAFVTDGNGSVTVPVDENATTLDVTATAGDATASVSADVEDAVETSDDGGDTDSSEESPDDDTPQSVEATVIPA